MQVFVKQEGYIEVEREWIHLEAMLPTRLASEVLVCHLYLSFEEVNVDIDGDLFPLQLLCDVYLPTLGAVYVCDMLNHCVLGDVKQILQLLPTHRSHIVDGLIEDVGFVIIYSTLLGFCFSGESVIPCGLGGGGLIRGLKWAHDYHPIVEGLRLKPGVTVTPQNLVDTRLSRDVAHFHRIRT